MKITAIVLTEEYEKYLKQVVFLKRKYHKVKEKIFSNKTCAVIIALKDI